MVSSLVKLSVFLSGLLLTALCLPASCDLTASIVSIDSCNRPFLHFQASFREFVSPGSSLFVSYGEGDDVQSLRRSQYIVSEPGIYPGQIVSFPSCRSLDTERQVCVEPVFGFLRAPRNQSKIYLEFGGGKSSNRFAVAMGGSVPPAGIDRGVHFEGHKALAQLRQTLRYSCLPPSDQEMSADDLLERCSNATNWVEELCPLNSVVWNRQSGYARSGNHNGALLYAPYVSLCPSPDGGLLLWRMGHFSPHLKFYLSFVDVVNITFEVTGSLDLLEESNFPNDMTVIDPPDYQSKLRMVDSNNFNMFVSTLGFDDYRYSFSVAVSDDASKIHRMSAQTLALVGPQYQGMRTFSCVMGFAECIYPELWKASDCRASGSNVIG